MSDKERNILVSVMIVLIPVGAFLAGWFTNDYVRYLRDLENPALLAASAEDTAVPRSDISLFWEAWHLVENNFIGDLPDERELSYAAIRGAMASLNDPYTVFLEPQIRDQEQISLRGNFGGIGAYVQRNEAGDVVLVPIPGNPAEEAGIQDGDILLAVDGTKITADMTTEEIATMIRGEKDTDVVLTVLHPDETDPTEVAVTRGDILVPSVFARTLPDQPDIGYIQLSRFSGESAREMAETMRELQGEGIKALILDLRGNGGGLLDASVDIADQFVTDGELLLQESRTDGERVYEATAEDDVAPDLPLVVLVDGNTASAAEILAGALQDNDRAELIGTVTFGKGSVQLVYDLSDGSSIHVTSARWLTPSGSAIDQQGLTPDIVIAPTEEALADGRDEILEEAIEYLRETVDLVVEEPTS